MVNVLKKIVVAITESF